MALLNPDQWVDLPITLANEKFPDAPVTTNIAKAFEDAGFSEGPHTSAALDALMRRLGLVFDQTSERFIYDKLSERFPEKWDKILKVLEYHRAFVHSIPRE